ncbi:putative triacylglycerol lipase [Helianthus anomalus]
MATAQNLVILMFTTTLLLANCDPQVPCYFIFGDSLMDNGNNNHLLTQAKVNFPPYGIDFPDGPTGRFTNGRNTADVIAQLLGFDKFIPPFAIAKGGEILTGVNYASGAAGIRAETAEHLVRSLSWCLDSLESLI